MAHYKQDLVDIELNSGNIHRSFLNHSIGSGDVDANRFGIRTFRDGVPVDLSGASCQGVFINAEGLRIALTSHGTIDGNVAYITLPQACYNVEGKFTLAIKIVGGGVTGTMRIVDGMVDNTGTVGTVAPTSSVPTYQEILDTYAAMTAATAAANLAIAEEFDATKPYPEGKYVINDGALYRITADHEANVTWANTSKVATNFGAEVYSLNAALFENYVKDKKFESVSVPTSATYSSLGVEIKKGKLYKIEFHATGWTAPSSGTYALILRTTSAAITNSTNFGTYFIENIIILAKADLSSNGNVDYSILFRATEDAKYISYFVRSGVATTFNLEVDVPIAYIDEIKDALNYEIHPARCLFYSDTYHTGTDSGYATANGYVASVEFQFSAPTYIKITNGQCAFVYTGTWKVTGYITEFLVPANTPVILTLRNGTTQAAMVDGITFYTTAEGAEYFNEKYKYEITDTFRMIRTFTDIVYTGGLAIADSGKRGLRNQYGTELRKTGSSKLYYSQKKVTIYVNRYYASDVYIMSPAGIILATITQAKSYTVQENTEFMVAAITNSTPSGDSELGANIILSVEDDSETYNHYTLPYNTTLSVSRVDCAFMDENGVMYFIDRSNEKYYVIENGEQTAENALDGTVGHANSCNYIDGNVYVSDWTNKTLIHVFAVDTTEKTLTYSKDITIPVPDDDGATEYFVLSGEKQIISLGMTNNYTAMRYALWSKSGDTYIKSRDILLPMMDNQAGWIQGFTFVKNKVIYIMGQSNYHHIGLGVLDIETGMLDFLPTLSNVSSEEIEAIIPVGSNTFIDVQVRGNLYTQYISIE